jgi:glycerophosphoryl diester phosphodiesterase
VLLSPLLPLHLLHQDIGSGQDSLLTKRTLPAFAIGLKDGVTSLEFDCGLTKDGAVIVWHDEIIDATKCRDTGPAFEGDEIYPYVGKNVANLTLAQIKTLDCGSLRIDGFPFSGTSFRVNWPLGQSHHPKTTQLVPREDFWMDRREEWRWTRERSKR